LYRVTHLYYIKYNLLKEIKALLSYSLKMASCKPKHVAAVLF